MKSQFALQTNQHISCKAGHCDIPFANKIRWLYLFSDLSSVKLIWKNALLLYFFKRSFFDLIFGLGSVHAFKLNLKAWSKLGSAFRVAA